jgi:integrase
MAKAKRKLWSYNTGKKGVSWVRVFERSQSSSSLYVEWFWKGKRSQRALRSVVGHPVTDHRVAMSIAEEMSATIERSQNDLALGASRMANVEEGVTLGEAVERYHTAKADGWSDHHRKAQERNRRFWLATLGADTLLTHITPELVEGAPLKGGGSTQRKTLMYMRGLFSWSINKARMIPLSYDLHSLAMPSVSHGGQAYSVQEIQKLLKALEEEGPEAAWMGQVAWQTGRRSGAILAVTPEDVLLYHHEDVATDDPYVLITFRKEHDKSNKVGQAALSGRGYELTKALLKKDRKFMTGGVSADKALRGWLYRAEERAGIDRVKGRGWHSFKRAFATAADNMGAASKQSGTSRGTLTGIYEQDWVAPKVELASRLEELARGSGGAKKGAKRA